MAVRKLDAALRRCVAGSDAWGRSGKPWAPSRAFLAADRDIADRGVLCGVTAGSGPVLSAFDSNVAWGPFQEEVLVAHVQVVDMCCVTEMPSHRTLALWSPLPRMGERVGVGGPRHGLVLCMDPLTRTLSLQGEGR